MSNPTEPDRPDETTDEVSEPNEQDEHGPHSGDERTEVLPESEQSISERYVDPNESAEPEDPI